MEMFMINKKPFYNLDGIESNFTSLYGEITNFQKTRYCNAFSKFKQIFDHDSAYIASSSGRVEVCGNHTDHNGGKVVSCAISLDSLAFFMPTEDGVITIQSEGYPKMIIDTKLAPNEKIGTSPALVRGVVEGLKKRGYLFGGFNAYITSNVLGGAGISSSASFEVLICEILNFLYNDGKINRQENAYISQFSENVYFGKPCGLLDQTAIAYGGLKKLDFADPKNIVVDDVNCDLSDYSLVLINTGGSHANLTDEYAAIPAEMKSVAKAFGKERLIEIEKSYFFANLKEYISNLSDRAVLRAIHFYEENDRVDLLCDCLEKNDYQGFLKCIDESGKSSLCKLQNCYVSGSKEQLIPRALAIASNYLCGGANRVHGGGFAGTTLNIVKNDKVDYFINNVKKFFGEQSVVLLKVRSVGVKVL